MTGSDHPSISACCISYKLGQCDSLDHADFTLTTTLVEIFKTLQRNMTFTQII